MRIRRVAGDTAASGATPAYWDHLWEGVDIEARVARAETTPSDMERALLRNVVADPILEAGCGSGWVLELERRRGRLAVGLDFAETTLRRVRRALPTSLLVVGDLERLPFRDGAFGTVVSLGALEHIELGPDRAIAEHARVLAEGGVLFATLPRVSWVKAFNDTLGVRIRRAGRYRSPRGRWVSLERSFGTSQHPVGFIQYELPSSAWAERIAAAGLGVEHRREIFVGAGLGEVGVLRRWRGAMVGNHEHEHAAGGERPVDGARRSVLRRWWNAGVRQEPATTAERAVAWLMRRAVGHMVLLVARKGAGGRATPRPGPRR